MKIKSVRFKQKSYPQLLGEISHPPKIIHYLGSLPADLPTVAIVGSRKVTHYGLGVTYRLAYDLAEAGFVIVSGLAVGIDTAAHQAALDAKGKTIAVMGTGLDSIYPATNKQLAHKIVNQGGAILSEYPPGTPPLRYNFPARNRIVSGLSLGVIVTEAPARSGALITAAFALEQNRLVMAVPANITNLSSSGSNNLLKAGAHLVTDAADVASALDLAVPNLKAKLVKPASAKEAKLLELLAADVNDSEDLLKQSGLKPAEFNQTLTLMEISGKIKNLGGGKWIVAS